MIITLPFEPRRKRADNHTITRPNSGRPFVTVVDPDAKEKADVAEFIASTNELKAFTGPVSLTLHLCFQVPESCSKKERAARLQCGWAFDKNFDCDNAAKFYLDALQTGPLRGRIFQAGKGVGQGDSIVAQLTVRKYWVEGPSYVRIVINSLDPLGDL